MLRAVQDPYYRPAIIAVVACMIAQQFTGINSLVMYSVSLLQSLLPTGAALLTIMTSVINLFATIACMPLPDWIGRKTCILLSISGIGCSSILLALGFALNQQIISAIAALLIVGSFAVGLGPVPFLLASELVGPEAVGAAQSWGLSTNWMATFVVAQFFPIVNDGLGGQGRVYWIFAGMESQCYWPSQAQAFTEDPPVRPNNRSSAMSPAIRVHSPGFPYDSKALDDARNVFARAFQCPTDTSACTSINQPDLCCPNGQSFCQWQKFGHQAGPANSASRLACPVLLARRC